MRVLILQYKITSFSTFNLRSMNQKTTLDSSPNVNSHNGKPKAEFLQAWDIRATHNKTEARRIFDLGAKRAALRFYNEILQTDFEKAKVFPRVRVGSGRIELILTSYAEDPMCSEMEKITSMVDRLYTIFMIANLSRPKGFSNLIRQHHFIN